MRRRRPDLYWDLVIALAETRGWRCALGILVIVLCASLPSAGEVDFPDPALRAAIEAALGIEGDAIEEADLASLTTLVASARGIADLTGLERCTSLEHLYLDGNDIADVAPLSGLPSLQVLTLNGNVIVDVTPLAALDHLTSLTLHANPIADLGPLAALSALTSLSIGNLIDDLSPLAMLPHLTRLMVTVLPTADLSWLSNLEELELLTISSGRTLTERPAFDPAVLSRCVRLTTLRLEGYDVASISDLAASAPSLRNVELHYVGVGDVAGFDTFPQLGSLTLDGVAPSSEGLDLSSWSVPPTITSLSLENDELDDLMMLAAATQLTQLSLKRNRIPSIEPLAALTSLTVLDLSFNPITDLTPLQGLTSLRSLTLQGVPFERTEGSATNRVLRELLERGVNISY